MDGVVYMIPASLGLPFETTLFAPAHREVVNRLQFFVTEKARTARRFIRELCPDKDIRRVQIMEYDKHEKDFDRGIASNWLKEGNEVGVLSEAGCPGVADPGSGMAALAHELNCKVRSLVGPSSLLLALMASGLGGQQFVFHGYLPIDKGALGVALRKLEQAAYREGSTQIFIETPYRNMVLVETLVCGCRPTTLLCIACDLSLSSEYVRTLPVSEWRQRGFPNLHKRPTVFLMGASPQSGKLVG